MTFVLNLLGTVVVVFLAVAAVTANWRRRP